MPERNGNALRVPLILLVAFLLMLMGAGYAYLDQKKADKDLVLQMQQDVRELRNYFLGEKVAR